MNRRDFIRESLSYIATSALLADLPEVAGAAKEAEGRSKSKDSRRGKPNILLIVADDLGYAELGAYGGNDIPTPNIDSIAQHGVRFTDGYVSCPVCSPTRAGMLTGRYQQRFGHEFNPGPQERANPDFGLPLTEAVLPERLRSLGYATGMVGKWHLGFKPESQPMKRGFDEFFGFFGGAHSYLASPRDQRGSIVRGTEPVAETEYLTEALAREAVSFVERHQREPFFLYLPFNAVHAPMQATEKYLSRFSGITDAKRRTFAAMLSALDDAVGTVLQKLRELKVEENTLIFFISDNGGPTPQTTSRNNPLRGTKAAVLEGGIRVPFMVQWKGRLPAGKTYSKPVISLDIHPTAFAAAGGHLPGEAKLDGIDLLPYLTGKNTKTPHDRLYWRFGDQCAIIKGDWKLVRLRGGSTQLYNLKEDVGEKNDLASPNPEKVKELQADYDEWNGDLMEPRWGRAGGRKIGRRQRFAPKRRRNPLRKPD